MARISGSKNKLKPVTEGAFVYTLEQRMQIIADLVVEKIMQDQSIGRNIADILDMRVEDEPDT